ncbi:MAG: crotonase/enoyl-CoA hydratase family protein [Actinomycetes bacterium]
MNSTPVSLVQHDGVALLTFDDGKVNAMSYSFLSQAYEAFSDAAAESSAIVIAGRPGYLSAGFDLTEVTKGPQERDAIIDTGGRLFGEIFRCPKPVVIACTGHAVAGGLVFLLTGDTRVGALGSFRIGFNEVLINVPMPEFGIALTQYRVPPQFCEPVLLGDLLDPEQAKTVGLLDTVVEPGYVVDAAMARARELAGRGAQAYATTKLRSRAGLLARFGLAG